MPSFENDARSVWCYVHAIGVQRPPGLSWSCGNVLTIGSKPTLTAPWVISCSSWKSGLCEERFLGSLAPPLMHSYPQTDLFLPSDNLVSVITMFARGRGTYLSWSRCHSFVSSLPEHIHHCSCTLKSAVISVHQYYVFSLPTLLLAFLPLVYF